MRCELVQRCVSYVLNDLDLGCPSSMTGGKL
jgi:hypothetical protein